ncbi:MAG: tRNA (N(6)-L-threonylcarbamoyladenosine(37)-C(2))-methylthiotransferase MtaB, partial [Lachnospiraceae bacterium]|nr:tRNA (N(6)-L-threonylcarbamoyladenosine(37)-C(2))-methylthiotransferase MtaB [Candidatus Minthocola equi]
MKKVAFITLGCKVNAYETESMSESFIASGYEVVSSAETADIYIINTCSVTNIADRKSRQMIHRARKKAPGALIVAVGCYVQADPEAAKADPAVDLIIGTDKKSDIVRIVEQHIDYVTDIAGIKEYDDMHIKGAGERTRAFVKIQDGCNQFCSYCLIPYVRGRVRSRSEESVLEEVKALAAGGIKEVVLTGIHLSSYGAHVPSEWGEPLIRLIRKVNEIEGIKRIRLGSLEPRIITREFAAAISEIDKLCPHFHLSLQSGCDETLARMNRHYTSAEYAEKLQILREVFINPALTTDVIVGFPGETDEEFAQTVDFLKKINLYEMHIFQYSLRARTAAE